VIIFHSLMMAASFLSFLLCSSRAISLFKPASLFVIDAYSPADDHQLQPHFVHVIAVVAHECGELLAVYQTQLRVAEEKPLGEFEQETAVVRDVLFVGFYLLLK